MKDKKSFLQIAVRETGKHSSILSVHVAPLAKDSDTVVEQGNDNWSGEIDRSDIDQVVPSPSKNCIILGYGSPARSELRRAILHKFNCAKSCKVFNVKL